MLESTLDSIASTPPLSATSRHLLDLCQAPSHMDDEYLRARIEETQWEAICHILDGLSEAELQGAIDLVNTHCTAWNDAHRVAPAHWLEHIMAGTPCPAMQVVRHVDARGLQISKEMLQNLCNAPSMHHVTSLRLDETKLSSWAGQLLANSALLDNLRELYLNYNPIGDEALAHLCEHGRFAAMQVLGLAHTNLGDETLKRIATNITLHQLNTLQLNQNQITDAGLKALAMARHLGNLEQLHLYMNPHITDEGASALRQRRERAFPRLQEVDVYDCAVSDVLSQRLGASYWLLHQDEASDPTTQNSSEPMWCGGALSP